MKPLPFALVALLGAIPSAHAATVQALFTAQTQTSSPETITGASGLVSVNTFPTTPTISRTGNASTNTGGESDYVDFQGRTWLGSGTSVTPGYSFGWGPNAGATLTVTVNLSGIQDLTIQMSIRSAITSGTPLTAFSAIDYSLNGVDYFTAASGTSLNFSATGAAYNPYSVDLTNLTAIENQSSVRIRFTLDAVPTNSNIRLDNILLTAQTVPEASSLGALAMAAGMLGFVRRR